MKQNTRKKTSVNKGRAKPKTTVKKAQSVESHEATLDAHKLILRLREKPTYVNPDILRDNPDNPYDGDTASLKNSISDVGILTPILARKEDKLIISGHRRKKAGKELGITVPVVFIEGIPDGDIQRLTIALNEEQQNKLSDTKRLALYRQVFRNFDADILLETRGSSDQGISANDMHKATGIPLITCRRDRRKIINSLTSKSKNDEKNTGGSEESRENDRDPIFSIDIKIRGLLNGEMTKKEVTRLTRVLKKHLDSLKKP